MSVSEAEFVTVAEAAKSLGIGEKRLRRILTRPEYRDRTRTGTTQTRTGTRTVTLLPSLLYADIRAHLELQPMALSMGENRDNGDKNGDADNADTVPVHVLEQGQRGQRQGQNSPETTLVRVSVSALTALYDQRLATLQQAHERELAAKEGELTAKDQVIAAKDETIAALKSALGHYQAEKAPQPMPAENAQEATSAAHGLQAAQNRDSTGDTVSDAPIATDTAQNGQRRGFWRRLVDSFSGGG